VVHTFVLVVFEIAEAQAAQSRLLHVEFVWSILER